MRFERLKALVGKDGLERIHRKCVIVYGLGGVGGHACEALARSGVGTLHIVDHDTVDPTNINRQIIALDSTVGQSKTDVFKKRIHDINPDCTVHAHQDAFSEETADAYLSIAADYVVDAIDDVEAKVRLIEAYRRRGVPIISAMGLANKMHPESIRFARLGETQVCPLARVLRRRLRADRVPLDIPVVFSTEKPSKPTDDATRLGSNAFVPATAGLFMASHVINQWMEESS